MATHISADAEEVKRSCSLLCLDVPEGTQFGIDYHEFTSGKNFKGVKLVPYGLHFIFYAGGTKYGGEGPPRTGMFLFLNQGQVKVLKWNPQEEDFYDQSALDQDEMERYAAGVERYEFDQFLGPYPRENYTNWVSLSNFITESVLSQLEPLSKKISSLYDAGEQGGLSKEEKKILGSIPTSDTKYRPYYSKLTERGSQKGTGNEITQFHFDKTELLKQLMKRYDTQTGLLGELQFAFICFLMGQSYDGFDQWKQLLSVFCGCDEGMHQLPELFYYFIGVFHFQLQQVPEDFFVDILSGKNFLTQLLKDFLELLSDDKLDSRIKKRAEKFKEYLIKRFGDVFGGEAEFDEDDEYAPTVVEM